MSEENGNLYERLERDALFSMPEDDAGEEELDVVRALTGAEVEASDLTLGGYIESTTASRLEGADGQPRRRYRRRGDGRPLLRWVAFLIFSLGRHRAGIMGQRIRRRARGDIEEAARRRAGADTVRDQSELDAAIERRRELERKTDVARFSDHAERELTARSFTMVAPGARSVARRFVAGETIEEGIVMVRSAQPRGH